MTSKFIKELKMDMIKYDLDQDGVACK